MHEKKHVSIPLISGQQFDALARLLRLRAGPASAAARLVLVDGLRPAQAAARTGCSPQSASNALARCRKGLALARVAVGEDVNTGKDDIKLAMARVLTLLAG